MKGLLAFFALSLVLCAQPSGFINVKQFNSGNSITILQDTKAAIYNAPENFVGPLFISNHRRDALGIPAGQIIAPKTESDYFGDVQAYWSSMAKTRFHYYAQYSTKIFVEPLEVKRWVKNGDWVEAAGVKFQVMATPGYTRGAVSYLAVVDGKRCAFTGDLIYGDGKIFDLYSF